MTEQELFIKKCRESYLKMEEIARLLGVSRAYVNKVLKRIDYAERVGCRICRDTGYLTKIANIYICTDSCAKQIAKLRK